MSGLTQGNRLRCCCMKPEKCSGCPQYQPQDRTSRRPIQEVAALQGKSLACGMDLVGANTMDELIEFIAKSLWTTQPGEVREYRRGAQVILKFAGAKEDMAGSSARRGRVAGRYAPCARRCCAGRQTRPSRYHRTRVTPRTGKDKRNPEYSQPAGSLSRASLCSWQ